MATMVVENRVYQVKGAYMYKGMDVQEGFDATAVEFSRMFMAETIPLAEQLAKDWLTQLHGELTRFEAHHIALAEDIIAWVK